jgi:hypothetical protein
MFCGRILGIVSLFVGGVSVCSVAHAETDGDLETAKALFEDGRRLMTEGKYDAACGFFQQSLVAARGIGTKFNLADCEEHRENFGKAQALFLEVAEQAREAGQADRERLARDRAAAIDEKLAHLQIDQDAPRVDILLDGRALSGSESQELLAIPPGKHRITASAPGKKTWTKEIDVPKAGTFALVTVPRLEDAAPRATPGPGAARVIVPVSPLTSTGAPLADTDPNRGRDARRVALVLGGVGLGAAIVGVGFGLQALADNHDAKNVCPTSYGCSDTDVSQHASFVSDAHSARTRSYLGFGVGAAALTGAAVLYFTSPRPGALRATTGFDPNGSWNVSVRGDF